MLRKLLGKEKIELEPVGAGRQRGYNFRGALRIDRLIGGDTFGTHLTVVAPTGNARETIPLSFKFVLLILLT